jgi:GT2 family glycosyltransferase
VIVVDRPLRLGPAGARNIGARQASCDVLVFVDADVEVHQDAFVRIRDAFERDAELAAVFGSYDDDPAARDLVSDFRNLLHHHVHHEGAGIATTFWAGLGAIRRDLFIAVGGFDEERFQRASVEDIELGSRLHEHGAKVVLDPAIQGRHLKKWSLSAMAKTDLFDRAVPWLRLLLEGRSRTTALNLGWRHRIGSVASLLLVISLIKRRFRLVVPSFLLVLVLEREFYGLLLRRRGMRQLVASVPLHVLHRLTSVAAVPIALVAHVLALRKARRSQ